VPILADYRDADAGGGQCFGLDVRNPLAGASVEGGERPVVDVSCSKYYQIESAPLHHRSWDGSPSSR
jgi:hypothetical protein